MTTRSTRPSPSNRATASLKMHLHPVVAMERLDRAADLARRAPGTGAVSNTSTTVTSSPSVRSEAATSAPMNPMPTHDHARARRRRVAGSARRPRRTAGRSTPARSAPGIAAGGSARRSRRSSASNGDPLAARRARPRGRRRRAASARVPNRSSIPCSSHHSGGRTRTSSSGSSPRRYSFDSGGRSYGGSVLRADQHDPAVEPFGAQRRGRGGPGEAAATTTIVRVRHRHTSICSSPPSSRDGERRDRLGRRPFTTSPTSCRRRCRGIRIRSSVPVDLAAERAVALAVRADVAERVERAVDPATAICRRSTSNAFASPSATSSARPTVMNSAMRSSLSSSGPLRVAGQRRKLTGAAPGRGLSRPRRLAGSPGSMPPLPRAARSAPGEHDVERRQHRGCPTRNSIGSSAGRNAPATHASWNSTS